ncbi:immunoglobulin domain-containing protein [Ditylenchus destructor]|nr:immunoglobulin domain-containing protein [Ditylenchus destructor]
MKHFAKTGPASVAALAASVCIFIEKKCAEKDAQNDCWPNHSERGRLARAPDLGLTIHSIQSGDQAVFQCSLTKYTKGTIALTDYGQLVRLMVRSLPQILQPAPGRINHFYIRPDASFQQTCLASGTPPPHVIWTKDNNSVSDNALLRIDKFEATDRGEYTCTATNEEGEVVAKIFLQIANGAVVDRNSLRNKTVVEGDSVFWQCSAKDAQPFDTVVYKWSHDSRLISHLEVGLRAHVNHGEFGIFSIKRSDHGWYTCEANNGYQKPDSASVFLNVQYHPEVLVVTSRFYAVPTGGNAKIECHFDANPLVTKVHWTKNGNPVFSGISTQNEHNTLSDKITPEEMQGTGTYTCRAENAVGSSSVHEVYVIVAEPPQFFPNRPPPIIHIAAGQHLEVECAGFGDPPPAHYWTRKGRKLTNTSMLVIDQVLHKDHGLYECILSNPIATLTHKMMLYVEAECVSDNKLQIRWVSGYSSDSEQQKFRVWYRKLTNYKNEMDTSHDMLVTKWNDTASTDSSTLILDSLEPLSIYELMIEPSNKHGAVNCSFPLPLYPTCSTLPAPINVRIEETNNTALTIKWEPVQNVQAYRVHYRFMPSTSAFNKLADVKEAEIKLESERLKQFNQSSQIEFSVQSLNPFFNESELSLPVYHPDIGSSVHFVRHCALSGLFVLIFALLLHLARKYHIFQREQKKRIKGDRQSFGNYIFPENQVQSQWEEPCSSMNYSSSSSSFESQSSPSQATMVAAVHCRAVHREDAQQYYPENSCEVRLAQFSDDGFSEDINGMCHLAQEVSMQQPRHNAIEEMFRLKYIHKNNQLLKNNSRKLDFLDELKIERLRLEMNDIVISSKNIDL